MNNKNALRIQAKNLRKSLNMDEISIKLTDKLRHNDFYINAKHVMLFYPMQDEVNLLGLLKDDKFFYFPRVNDENLEVCCYNCADKFRKSDFGVLEPCCDAVKPDILDLVIVPALMADKNGYRLGYGGGYYDRFLSLENKNFKSITLIPIELFVEKLPVDDYDVKVDKVIVY